MAEVARCALEGFRIPCHGRIQRGHIINFSMARGNPEVRRILKRQPEELMAPLCAAHNTGRWSESAEGRQILLKRNIRKFGRARMTRVVDSLPWKTPKPEWTLEGMLA